MENIQTVVNTNSINSGFAIDLEEFANITGTEVTVSDISLEKIDEVAKSQQALRDLEKAAATQKSGWYDVRATFMSDGSGPAEPVEFSSLVGAPGFGNLVADLDELAAEYGRYVDQLNVAEARSNTFLNSILAKCYAKYALFLRQSEKEQKRILNSLDAYMLDRDISVTGKTYTLSKFLMCVFVGADAKKINSYYSAIAYAQKQDVKPENFSQYVQEFEGGLTAMRLANAQSKKAKAGGQAVLTRDEKLVQAQKMVNTRELAVFESEVLAQNVDAAAGQIVLIATPLSGGKYAVNGGLSDKAVVEAALLAFYKTGKEAIDNEQKEQAQASEADQVDQLAAQAAAMAS